MNNNEFIELLYSDLVTYFIVLISIFFVYYLWFGRKIKHLADPLMIGFIAQVFSCSVVFFLFFKTKIDDFYFYSFCYTELMFLIPLLFIGRDYVRFDANIEQRFTAYKGWSQGYSIFYYATAILLITTSMVYFAKVGFPILNQLSRLDTNESVGVLSWFTDVYWVCFPAMVVIKRYVFHRKSLLDVLLIVFCFFCLLVKGGKSDFFFLIVSLFMVKEVYQIRELNKIVKILTYVSPFVVLGLMLIIFNVWGSNGSVLNSFFERFILFGDVFYQGYDKGFMTSLPKDIYFWDYFFGGTINKIRDIFGFPLKEKVVFGYEISRYYYNIDSGIGPNARQNILGLYLFGPYFSGAFSFALGMVYLSLRSAKGIIGRRTKVFSLRVVFYIIFCTYSCFIFVDPSLTLGLYLKIIFVFLIPLCLSLFNIAFINKLIVRFKEKNL